MTACCAALGYEPRENARADDASAINGRFCWIDEPPQEPLAIWEDEADYLRRMTGQPSPEARPPSSGD